MGPGFALSIISRVSQLLPALKLPHRCYIIPFREIWDWQCSSRTQQWHPQLQSPWPPDFLPCRFRRHPPLSSSPPHSPATNPLFSLRKHVSFPLVWPRNFTVHAKGGFIPAENRWMYEVVEKMGPDVWNTTYFHKADDHKKVEKKWFIVDTADKCLGRLASTIAIHICGKNIASFNSSIDIGAYVAVVNAEKVALTGTRRDQKIYRRHSGRPGVMIEET